MDKQRLRAALLRPLRRARARIVWRRWSFADLPVVFGNAMPKSGSKLLMQVLQGICQIGPFVLAEHSPLRTITIDGRTRSQEEIVASLRQLAPGDVALGYLRYTAENAAFLCRPNWATYFILRDPRDMLVSHVFYATEMYPGHGMHKLYVQLPSMDERLKIAIRGMQEGSHLPDVGERYRRMVGWLERSEVLALRFEDFILEREKTLEAMLRRLEQAGYRLPFPRSIAMHKLAQAIDPKRSPTFRTGQVGGWRAHFTEEHKSLFKEVAGDILIRLGYEKDNDW